MGRNRIWLSYDLGVDGDYDGLYSWLDRLGAVECGESSASMVYNRPLRKGHDLVELIRSDLKKNVKLRVRDRVYLIYKKPDGKILGKFLFGSRKAAPWTGYAPAKEGMVDEG
jgi:hypothetical protein